ncbi:hypothetical protein [Burkholderia cenocepacia]|uniref:hypothetical protein n=1 Tax=Burkholderia cenocepacia TaxID=95486 RepID=UPI00286F7601|nr:hypothetical protein [Burkholderia cenocepacia]
MLDTLPTGQVIDAARADAGALRGRVGDVRMSRRGVGHSSGLPLADATCFGRNAGHHAAQIMRRVASPAVKRTTP